MTETTSAKPLTFAELRRVNAARCEESFRPLNSWNLLEWSGAMCGEAGETANVAKKIVYDKHRKASTEDLKHEIGGTLAYLDLLATRAGLRLEDCVVEAFNDVSVRVESPLRLAAGPEDEEENRETR